MTSFFYKKYLLAVSCVLCALLVSCGGDAKKYGELGSPKDALPLMETVRTGMLPSGLQYYILENKKPEGRAYITLAVNAGSVQEDEDERGLAHFVEHMSFDGTERFPGTEVIEYLRSLGMRFGADVNAYTSFDRTVYGIEVPVAADDSGARVLPERALQIIDDWTRAVSFTQKDVDEERPIIIEEYRRRLGASDRMTRRLITLLFEGSKYAERLPIGLPEIVETAPPERLKGFYNKWYRADNMALIFVGDFDGAVLEKSLAANFSITKPEAPVPVPVYDLPAPQKGKIAAEVFTDPEITAAYFSLYYKLPFAPPGGTLKDFRADVIDNLAGKIIAERFSDAERLVETPYFDVEMGQERVVKQSVHYVIQGAAKTGLVKEALAAVLKEKERIARYGFLESEIERAKIDMLSNLEKSLAEKEKIDSSAYIYSLTENFLTGESVPGIEWELNAVKNLLAGINAKDLQDAVKNYFSADDVLVFITANAADQSAVISTDEIIEIVKQSKKEKIEKPEEAVLSGDLLDAVPQPGAVISEDYDEKSETVIWQLSNGAKVFLKTTNNQNDQIVLSAAARGGTTSAAINDIVSAKLAAEMISASGLGKWKLSELTKKLAGKQVSVSFNTAAFSRSIEGSSTNGDLPAFFELLYLGFTAPRIDEDAVAVLKDEYKTVLVQHKDDPNNYFQNELTKTIYNENPYFMPFELEDLAKIDIQTAKSFADKCLNPADYAFVFTGNIDAAAIRPLVETYLASIPAKEPFNEWMDQPVDFPQNVDKALYKGKEDKSTVYLGRLMNRPFTMQQVPAANVLDEYLDIVLIREIREKLGGVYSISPYAGTSPVPPPGETTVHSLFGCAPNRVNELSVAVESELAKIAAGAIDRDAFDKAQAALIKGWESSMQNNRYISKSFVNYTVLFDAPLAYLYELPEVYEKVTPADITAFTKNILQRSLVRVVLYPEK